MEAVFAFALDHLSQRPPWAGVASRSGGNDTLTAFVRLRSLRSFVCEFVPFVSSIGKAILPDSKAILPPPTFPSARPSFQRCTPAHFSLSGSFFRMSHFRRKRTGPSGMNGALTGTNSSHGRTRLPSTPADGRQNADFASIHRGPSRNWARRNDRLLRLTPSMCFERGRRSIRAQVRAR
jgi:hypothetical protein